MLETTVSNLHIYPIKSTAGISLPQANVDELGLAFDRRFVLRDDLGQFITGRTKPQLCLVKVELSATGIILNAPNMPALSLNHQDFSHKYMKVTVWGDVISGQFCSMQANDWFCHYLQQSCQLLFFGEQSHREKKPNTPKARKVAFADGYPLLLISQASLADLNQRLQLNNVDPVSMAHFRPNIVVDNCPAFAEDTWQHIRIGEVEFIVSKPCERCIFTTVNPENGERQAQQQPLRTLQSFRAIDSGEVIFGQNLIPLNKGEIKQGDKVTVLSTQIAPVLIPSKAATPDDSQLTLTCSKIIDETHDVKTFLFTFAEHGQFKQLAGQHINFQLEILGVTKHCCYTIASAPTSTNEISLTIKRVPQGIVSNYFHDHVKIGDAVIGQVPSGTFHLPERMSENMPEKILLLSAGSGITPMLSMLRHMVAQKVANEITFFHSAHSEADLIARQEIADLATQHGNCHISYTLTKQVKPQWQDYQGHLTQTMLSNIPALIQHQVFVCGPQGFRESAQQHLQQLGLPQEQYHWESFGARPLAINDREQTITNEPKALTINFQKWQKPYQGDNQETLLEQGEDADLVLPYSCRAGMCGRCKAKLISGEVKQSSSDGLTDFEKSQGYILCCASTPITDVTIKHD